MRPASEDPVEREAGQRRADRAGSRPPGAGTAASRSARTVTRLFISVDREAAGAAGDDPGAARDRALDDRGGHDVAVEDDREEVADVAWSCSPPNSLAPSLLSANPTARAPVLSWDG